MLCLASSAPLLRGCSVRPTCSAVRVPSPFRNIECPLAKNFRSFSRSRHFIGPDDDPFSVALFAFLAVVENGHN
jgi:hypothetical protein